MVLKTYTKYLTILLFWVSLPSVAAVTAKVDRTQLSLNESLQLVVSFDQRPNGSTPDTSALLGDFDILGTSQSSRQTYINGQSEVSTDWIYTLAPKREGMLTIPPISFSGDTTQAINITVGPASQQVADSAVFLDSAIDNDSVYVQQQIVLTLRVYHAVSLGRNASLSEPLIPDAIVNKLKESEFQTQLNGRDYRVFEQRFAIFPQKSGQLDIPASVLTATIPTRRNRSMFDPFNIDGQAIRISSDSYTVNVLPQPSQYTGTDWLPAENLQIVDDWNGSDLNINLGESVTRTVTVIAKGLLGAQIPPLLAPQVDGLKIYPDQAQVSDGEGDHIVGSRTESYAIIATKLGSFTLPEQRIVWWDSKTKQQKEAKLDAVTFHVTAAAGDATSTPSASLAPTEPRLSPPNMPPMDSSPALEQPLVTPPEQTSANINGWLLGGLIIVTLAWVLTLLLWWREKHRQLPAPLSPTSNSPSEQQLLVAITQACKAQRAQACLEALLAWGQTSLGCRSLKALCQYLNDDILNQQLEVIQQSLYKPAASTDLSNAYATVETRIAQLHAKKHAGSQQALPSLYK